MAFHWLFANTPSGRDVLLGAAHSDSVDTFVSRLKLNSEAESRTLELRSSCELGKTRYSQLRVEFLSSLDGIFFTFS